MRCQVMSATAALCAVLFSQQISLPSSSDKETTPPAVLARSEELGLLASRRETTVPLEMVGRFYLGVGESLLGGGHTAAARYELDRIMREFSKDFWLCQRATWATAQSYVKDGDTTAAVRAYDALVDQFKEDLSSPGEPVDPSMTASFASRYYAYSARTTIYREAGQFTKALDQLDKWLVLLRSDKDLGKFKGSPLWSNTVHIWVPKEKAELYFATKQYAEAIRYGEAVLAAFTDLRTEQAPERASGWKYSIDVELRILVGDSYLACGNRQKARMQYEHALTALKDPNRISINKIIPKLRTAATELRDESLPKKIKATRTAATGAATSTTAPTANP